MFRLPDRETYTMTCLQIEALQRVNVKPRSFAMAKAGNAAGERAEAFTKAGGFFQQSSN